jgi:hypothetical protein
VSEGHHAHFVIEAIEQLYLSGFKVNTTGSESERYPPEMEKRYEEAKKEREGAEKRRDESGGKKKNRLRSISITLPIWRAGS